LFKASPITKERINLLIFLEEFLGALSLESVHCSAFEPFRCGERSYAPITHPEKGTKQALKLKRRLKLNPFKEAYRREGRPLTLKVRM